MNNLNSIFNAILPENLKNTSVIQNYIDIFIEILEENSKVSLDSTNFFNDNVSNETKEELIKIYLYDYYSMLKRLKSDYYIVNRFRKENKILRPFLYVNDSMDARFSDNLVIDYFKIGGTVISSSFSGPEFDNVLSSEVNINPIYSKLDNLQNALLSVKPDNFYFNRLFKETKGFVSSIRFIYDCLNKYLVPDDERLQLEIRETGDPFKLLIKGSVDREIYRSGVEYLTHPLGFVYSYDQIRQITFEDYFSVKYRYDNSKIEVRCLYGNSETYNKVIKEVIKFNGSLKVIFDDLTSLVQENNEIKYLDSIGHEIKKYPESNHCSIFLSYDLIYVPTIYDNLKFKINNNFGFENILINDKMNSVLTYTPKVGIVIGRFFLGVGERFYKDNNIYSFVMEEVMNVRNVLRYKSSDNLNFSDNEKIEETKNISTTVIINDEIIKNIDKTKLIENIDIKEIQNIKHSETFSEEIYDKDILETIHVKLPLHNIDDEGENFSDFLNINGFNGTVENMKYDDDIREIIRTRLTDKIMIDDEITIHSYHLFKDNINILDTETEVTFNMTSIFKFGEVIGDGLIDGTIIIMDSDIVENYKYKETMDIT